MGIIKWCKHYDKMQQVCANTKCDKNYHKVGEAIYYKMGVAATAKLGDFITKWGRYDKVEQLLQGTTVQKSKVHPKVCQKNILPFPSPLIFLPGIRTNGGTCLQIEPMRFESRVV